ncbi:iron-containing alcohol dehydrogenase [Prolixibacteraceae bacterium Z1-6]|uniref:Iron-containing alcohol dehydrogenase n=1 Tax=Draconibacterium aestuarii TaxID=2998507 RepID=A0A9X3J7Y0_9BACT|nr:iron-containing alcohol dehydrogenase [Prolixibacteraceae bacterium Z1-6]
MADKRIGNITAQNPSKVVFGNKSFARFVDDFGKTSYKRLYVLTIAALKNKVEKELEKLTLLGVTICVNDTIAAEPLFQDYQNILIEAREFKADSVVGIGGGSVLDTAKLVAATLNNSTGLREIIADNSLLKRETYLACLPTTSGTGSEMSPNAIFFDPESNLKIGVISPALVTDATYIDPELTLGVPPAVTAATGLDALTHCIEAYVNKFAHPITDLLALEGIKLIGKNLPNAFADGNNIEAREKVAMGSMYGGMCLGPVNTAAVHALAYPLGSKYKISHGVSNALLLPFVMEFNLEEAIPKYANVARAIGIQAGLSDKETAH